VPIVSHGRHANGSSRRFGEAAAAIRWLARWLAVPLLVDDRQLTVAVVVSLPILDQARRRA
jgi:hypothetical protein